jgi:hypothetical protein
MSLHSGPGWRVECHRQCWWLVLGKYVLRIGIPWGHPYKEAWKPLFQFFRCYK